MFLKTGKHGHCKIHFVGIDVFTDKKHTIIHGSQDKVRVPKIIREDYQLTDINDEDESSYLILLSNKGIMREDIHLPNNDMGIMIRKKFENEEDLTISVQEFGEMIAAIAYKLSK